MSFKSIRQNPSALKSSDFIDFIKNNNLITCPWGHSNDCTDNVWNRMYNVEAKGQDKKFCEELNVGDYVVIPIERKKKFMLKKITNSQLKCKTFRNMYAIKEGNRYVKILNENSITTEFENPKYCIEFMKMTYKECENLGTFPYECNSNKFPRKTYSTLQNPEMIQRIKTICNIN